MIGIKAFQSIFVKTFNENCWVLTVARESEGAPACLFPQRTRKLPNGI